MLNFKVKKDEKTGEQYLETSLCGKPLLTTPQLNKGTAFTHAERINFGLLGKLPNRVETIEEQIKRAYQQYLAYSSKLQKNIYLNNLHDKNQVLFYKLLNEHLEEMLSTIYTPIVGTAVKQYSLEYRQPRGLYISYPDRHHIKDLLKNRTNPDIDLIVVTDGEGVLGIGDQGIGGMDIPIAKLMVYSLCGGIDPCRTLPVFLDVGTNNQELLNCPYYLGWRNPRIKQSEYDIFIQEFVSAIEENFDYTFLHWEDFGRHNARNILDTYQGQLCTFNDDIQGTGAVTLSALLAAVKATHSSLLDQKIVVFGAGSAGTGISDVIVFAMEQLGLSEEEAYQHFYLIDRQGLLMNTMGDLTQSQKPYAKSQDEVKNWQVSNPDNISLYEVIKNAKPTILIGCSAQTNAFSQAIIETMAKNCERPIIFPLSNPTEKCEAVPSDLLNWTKGQALIATGTAFAPVEYENRLIPIAQCNNALVFPGLGLGILAIQAKALTKEMIFKASLALSELSPILKAPYAPILPSLNDAQKTAKKIALAVCQEAIKSKLACINQNTNLEELIDELYWQPRYLPFRKSKDEGQET